MNSGCPNARAGAGSRPSSASLYHDASAAAKGKRDTLYLAVRGGNICLKYFFNYEEIVNSILYALNWQLYPQSIELALSLSLSPIFLYIVSYPPSRLLGISQRTGDVTMPVTARKPGKRSSGNKLTHARISDRATAFYHPKP
jgi:hypothetical protein